MYCSRRHVLRHVWHFPSWPKVLLAHCSHVGLGGGCTALLVPQQGSREGRYKITPCRFETSAMRLDSTNMELSVACLTCNANPLHHVLNHPRKLHHQKGSEPTLS